MVRAAMRAYRATSGAWARTTSDQVMSRSGTSSSFGWTENVSLPATRSPWARLERCGTSSGSRADPELVPKGLTTNVLAFLDINPATQEVFTVTCASSRETLETGSLSPTDFRSADRSSLAAQAVAIRDAL